MVSSCVITGCSDRHKSGKCFHRIPNKDRYPERHRLWLAAIARKNFLPQAHHRVCGRHFISGKANDDPSHPDYVPNLHLGYEATTMLDPEKKDVHDRCLKKITAMDQLVKKLYVERGHLTSHITKLELKTAEMRFDATFLGKGKAHDRTKFYTGLPSYEVFTWLVEYCAPDLPLFLVLTPSSQLFIVLLKMRLNLLNQDMALRFGVSTGTVSQVLNKSLPVVALKLSFLIHWPEKEDVLRTLPKIFRLSRYTNARVIIDCAEVFIERPGNLTARAQTWSNYKHHNTIKILVGISPTGAVTFVSKAFGGRVSDKVITQRSGFLDLIERGDLILADRGFLISEDLAARNASLLIPAFTRGVKQLSQKDIEYTRKLAHVRIHVERAIERIKNFKILSTTMAMNMVPHVDNIVTICAAICNLQPRLVKV